MTKNNLFMLSAAAWLLVPFLALGYEDTSRAAAKDEVEKAAEKAIEKTEEYKTKIFEFNSESVDFDGNSASLGPKNKAKLHGFIKGLLPRLEIGDRIVVVGWSNNELPRVPRVNLSNADQVLARNRTAIVLAELRNHIKGKSIEYRAFTMAAYPKDEDPADLDKLVKKALVTQLGATTEIVSIVKKIEEEGGPRKVLIIRVPQGYSL